ncbi:MAG: hypothetical protein K1X94_23405 [Sandaracinaceae bacterium]|nr:hypothetical protein [Sandaracinaceae bacterium]
MRARYRTVFSVVKRGRPLLAALLCVCACERPDPPAPLPLACSPEPTRTARLLARLTAAGQVVGDDLGPRICFAAGAGTVWPGQVISLPSDWADDPTAARLAHLLHHVREGRGLVAHEPRAGRDCEALVEEALREESRAHVVEMEVRATLGVTDPARRFVNEDEILGLPPTERAAAELAYLEAHPDGGGGYEPLGRDYRTRCLAEP